MCVIVILIQGYITVLLQQYTPILQIVDMVHPTQDKVPPVAISVPRHQPY